MQILDYIGKALAYLASLSVTKKEFYNIVTRCQASADRFLLKNNIFLVSKGYVKNWVRLG
jgi:hypothetical protein